MQMNSNFLDCHPSLLLNVGVFRMGGEKWIIGVNQDFQLLIVEYLKYSLIYNMGKGQENRV